MKKLKRLSFIISIIIVFVFNLIVSLDSERIIGIQAANAVIEKINYEDKFDVTIGIPGGVEIGICCDPDVTNGCWRWAWPTCK